MQLNNIINVPVQRLLRSIQPTANAIGNRITTVFVRTVKSMEVSIADKIETFSESHPRIIKALEPAICSVLLRGYDVRSSIQGTAVVLLMQTLITMVVAPPIVLSVSFAEYLALSETMIELVIAIGISVPTGIFLPILLLSIRGAHQRLIKHHLEQSVDINKLTAASLKLPPQFVAALNEWTRNESQHRDSRWIEARKKILDFYKNNFSVFLDLSHDHLYSLPDIFEIDRFRNKLQSLHLEHNHLTRVPGSIRNLHSLRWLDLSHNHRLSDLPQEILDLPSQCIVNISNCNFSAPVLANIRAITNQPDYGGPRILAPEGVPSIEQSCNTFYGIIGRNYNELPELREIPNLDLWLHKLTLVADFRGRSQQAFVTKIINYLEKANVDPSFREVFSATILDATESCGDRVALSILNLGVAYKLSIIDLNNMQQLYHLLMRGVLALDLLQDIARQKISTLQTFDEIEVYLGYPVTLKEDLDLPIDIEDMRYFGSSALSPQDLEDAKNRVLKSLNSREMQISFLKTQPKWVDALRMNYPEEMERMVENPETCDQNLIDLTTRIIESFNS